MIKNQNAVRCELSTTDKLGLIFKTVSDPERSKNLLRIWINNFENHLVVKNSAIYKIIKTTNKELMGELHCSGSMMTIHTKIISSKRHETDVVSTVAEMGVNEICTISEWKLATCPADVK